MAQLFRPGANSVAVLVIVALLVSAPMGAALTYLIWKSPYATNQWLTRGQPVAFSHAHLTMSATSGWIAECAVSAPRRPRLRGFHPPISV